MDLLPVSEQEDYLNILMYGPPDAGKTTCAASGDEHPNFSPTAIMDFEGGLQSIRWGKAMKTPRIETTEDIDRTIVAVASRQGGFANTKTLVVDSLTKMSSIILQGIVAKKHARQPRKGGLDEIQIADYGDLGKAVMRYVDMLVGLDMNIVFICLEREFRADKDGPVELIVPDLPGRLWSKVIATCDSVFALKKVPASEESEASVVMLTQQVGLQYARVRNDEFREELGGGVVNPTLPGIWETYQRALVKGRAKLEGQEQ